MHHEYEGLVGISSIYRVKVEEILGTLVLQYISNGVRLNLKIGVTCSSFYAKIGIMGMEFGCPVNEITNGDQAYKYSPYCQRPKFVLSKEMPFGNSPPNPFPASLQRRHKTNNSERN